MIRVIFLPSTPMWGGRPEQVFVCLGGVEYTRTWVGTSDLHGTRWHYLRCDLELLCNEAVLSRGREIGILRC